MGKYVKKCHSCGSSEIAVFGKNYDRHYGRHEKKYEIWRCLNCELLFLNPMISKAELNTMYPDDYYAYKTLSTKKNRIKKAIKRIVFGTMVKDYGFNPKGKKILDVGCGSGLKLLEFKENGAIVRGVEISKNACKIGNEHELNIFNGTLEEANFPDSEFDYVRSNHSFEHLTNPVETIKTIRSILKKEGKLFIGVPNTDSWNFKLFKNRWYYLGVPFHPFNYSPKSLTLLLESNGFEIESVRTNGNYQGVLGSVQIKANEKNGRKSTEGFFFNSKLLVVFAQQFARFSNLFGKGDCFEIIATKK